MNSDVKTEEDRSMPALLETNKNDFWLKHIEVWDNGTLSQHTYCSENNLSFSQFAYWRRRLKNKETKVIKANPKPSKEWIALTPRELNKSTASQTVLIELPGYKLTVPLAASHSELSLLFKLLGLTHVC